MKYLSNFLIATISGLVLTACVNTSVKNTGTPLSRSEIENLMIGKTIRSNNADINLDANGRYTESNGGRLRDKGKYVVQDGVVCLSPEARPVRNCIRVVKSENTYYWILPGGAGYPIRM